MILLQVIAWRIIRGEYVFYSYTNEGFDNWYKPKMLSVLFHIQNGFFVYAPVMLASIFGIFTLWKKQVGMRLVFIIFILATYVFGSWWAWWFGGAYGHRCYVEYLSFLSIPFIGFLQYVYVESRSKITPLVVSLFLVISVAHSMKMTTIYSNPWDGPEWNYNRFYELIRHAWT